MNFKKRIVPALAAALLLCTAPDESAAANRIDVKFVENLTLAGYGKKDDALKWAIDADRAELREGSAEGKDSLKNGVWNVRNLSVKTFADGKESVSVESPTAVFFPRERRAESDDRVSVRDAQGRFAVFGKGWIWKCDRKDDANAIAVRNDVVVKLYDAEKPAREITVTSTSLDIALHDNETVLTFRGNAKKNRRVRVAQGETVTHCDALTIVVPADAEELENASAKSSGGNTENASGDAPALKRIEKISGTGNAEIRAGTREVRGDTVDFTPGTNRFRVRGNVAFRDKKTLLEVRGDEAIGYMNDAAGKIALEKIIITDAAGTPVSVETPSLENRRARGDRAKFSAKKLSLILGENADETRILFENEVRVSDRSVTLNCDALDVRCGRLGNASGGNGLAAVREIDARGNVRATQEGRIIECGAAKIFPSEGRTTLTGNPRIRVPAQRFSLAGARCEISRDTKRLEVFRDEADEKSRVAATILDAGGAETRLSGKMLTVAPDSAAPEKFTIFTLDGDVAISSPSRELSGSCDRLLAFCDSEKSKAKKSENSANAHFDSVKKIEAYGNVRLEKGETKISGGMAQIFGDVAVQEWNSRDDDGSDGERPTKIIVRAAENDVSGETRPKITLPRTQSAAAVALPIPSSVPAKKSDGAGTIIARGDELETLLGEQRIRFWLRGNVSLDTADGHCTSEELEAEARRQNAKAAFEPEAFFCRRNVRIVREDATAFGDRLEIFPKRQIGFLVGNAKLHSARFGTTVPGAAAGDRFVLDLDKNEVRIETSPELLKDNPAQVATPRTTLPKGISERFSEKFKKSPKR